MLVRQRRARLARLVVGGLATCLGLFFLAWIASSSGTNVTSKLVVYGEDPSQFGRVWHDASDNADRPIVVVIHGGFWRRAGGDLSSTDPLAEAIAEAGFVVFNVEYGRTGEARGGWPHTFDHATEALRFVEQLERDYPIDGDRVGVVGHSAGGTLALWLARQPDPPDVVVALAPIVDLEAAASDRLGEGAVIDLLGGEPGMVPNRYAVASVREAARVPTLVITSPIDDDVAARYSKGVHGGEVEMVSIELDHLQLINPERASGDVVLSFLARNLGVRE